MKKNKFCFLNKKKENFNIRVYLKGDTRNEKNIFLNEQYFKNKKELNDVYYLVCDLNNCLINSEPYTYDPAIKDAVIKLAGNPRLRKVYKNIQKLGLIAETQEKSIHECLNIYWTMKHNENPKSDTDRLAKTRWWMKQFKDSDPVFVLDRTRLIKIFDDYKNECVLATLKYKFNYLKRCLAYCSARDLCKCNPLENLNYQDVGIHGDNSETSDEYLVKFEDETCNYPENMDELLFQMLEQNQEGLFVWKLARFAGRRCRELSYLKWKDFEYTEINGKKTLLVNFYTLPKGGASNYFQKTPVLAEVKEAYENYKMYVLATGHVIKEEDSIWLWKMNRLKNPTLKDIKMKCSDHWFSVAFYQKWFDKLRNMIAATDIPYLHDPFRIARHTFEAECVWNRNISLEMLSKMVGADPRTIQKYYLNNKQIQQSRANKRLLEAHAELFEVRS